jgi:hypothetical protein
MKTGGTGFDIPGTARIVVRRRVEKSSAASRLEEMPDRRIEPPARVVALTQAPRLSDSETDSPSRLSHTGIPSGFIAQILGQMTDKGRGDAVAAMRAYATAGSVGQCGRFIRVL